MLLTADDMIRRAHYRNAQRTLERLLGLGVLPVVNENDTVATDEIRVGDNDRLAALVAHLIGADGLVLLSDVDGLYDGDPRRPGARLLTDVDAPTDLADGAGGPGRRGQPGHRRHGHQDHRGRDGGGVRHPGAAGRGRGRGRGAGRRARPGRRSAPRSGRPGAGCRPAGSGCGTPPTCAAPCELDAGAVAAVLERRRSLLAAGIHGISGDFVAGDVVDLVGPQGTVVARGVVGFDAAELPELIGRRSRDVPAEQRREVVHADDLVPLSEPRSGRSRTGSGARAQGGLAPAIEPVRPRRHRAPGCRVLPGRPDSGG